MAYRFRKNEPLAHAIRRVFGEEIDWAVGQLNQSQDRDKAVHEARKSLKKIRGLLGLVAQPLGRLYKSEDRTFRRAGQKLSQLRDSAVLIQTFDGFSAQHAELEAAIIAQIKHNLGRGQREARDGRQTAAEVGQALADARQSAAAWPLEHLEFAALLPDLTAAYRAGRKALRKALKSDRAEAFHDFRKQVKQHWYHLRLFEGNLNSEMKQRLKELHALETVLGDQHNLTVLIDRIAADVETARDRHQIRGVLVLLDAEEKHLRARAIQSGEQLYAAKPDAFAQALSTLWPSMPHRPAAAAPLRKAAVA